MAAFDRRTDGAVMRAFGRVVLAFLAGTIVTYIVVVAGFFWYIEANQVFDRDGGMSMGIVFLIGPAAGILGGTICAIAFPIWLNRRDLRHASGKLPPRTPWPQAWRVGLAIVLAGVPAYLLGRFILWLYAGTSFDSYWVALVVSNTPLILAIAAAALAAVLASRKAGPRT